MLSLLIGAFVALLFLGLPLAIIALFIASTIERRQASAPKTTATHAAAAPAAATSYSNDKRRRVVYGRPPAIATKLPERNEPVRLRGTKA